MRIRRHKNADRTKRLSDATFDRCARKKEQFMCKIISKISEKLKLPYWWIESIAIEYTECREYAENGKIWTFNWNKLSEDDLKNTIQTHEVVIRNYLIHNIHKDVFPHRAANQFAGGILPNMAEESGDIIPEGLVSYYNFPFQSNPIETVDPKLTFSQWFQVLDDGRLWQWRIAEVRQVDGQKYSRWISDEIDLEPINQINEQLVLLQRSIIHTGEPGYNEFKQKVEQFYNWVNEIRDSILSELYNIHLSKKKKQKHFPKATTTIPPLLSNFETYTIRNGKYYSKFFADPIFYQGCIQHAKRAEEIANSINNERELAARLDEIYQERAIAIILGATCIEAFINRLLYEQCPKLWKTIERSSKRSSLKYKLNQYLISKKGNNLSDIKQSANQFLEKLIKCRNMLVHFKCDYQELKQCKEKPVTYIGCKLTKEFNRDLSEKLSDLIKVLCENTGLPIPKWLDSC